MISEMALNPFLVDALQLNESVRLLQWLVFHREFTEIVE